MDNLKNQIEKDIVENIKQIDNIKILKSILTLTLVAKNKSKTK